MTERYDVIYGKHGPYLEPHFCREWDGEEGYYGTNPEHGFSWEEARKEIADWYAGEAKRWRDMKEEELNAS